MSSLRGDGVERWSCHGLRISRSGVIRRGHPGVFGARGRNLSTEGAAESNSAQKGRRGVSKMAADRITTDQITITRAMAWIVAGS